MFSYFINEVQACISNIITYNLLSTCMDFEEHQLSCKPPLEASYLFEFRVRISDETTQKGSGLHDSVNLVPDAKSKTI